MEVTKDEEQHNFHDFLVDRRWLVLVEGFDEARSVPYKLYVCAVYIWNVFILAMAVYGCWMAIPNKDLMVGGLHVFLIALFAVWGLSTRIVTRGYIRATREMILREFYKYNEREDDVILNLRRGMAGEVRKRNIQFSRTVIIGAVSNVIFFPVSQSYLVNDEEYEKRVDLANPYLPHYIYLPWSTRSAIGLTAGFFLSVFLLVFIYGMAIVMNEIYTSCVIQLTYQLKILNHSIITIHSRALKLYLARNKDFDRRNVAEITESEEFKNCLYQCLVHNIQHHQSLLRFVEVCQPFIGSWFLLITLLASIIFASLLYLIMKNPPVNYLINYILTLMTEQTYSLYLCYFGEKVMEESGTLYESIYSVEWMDYDRRFTRALQIFMIKVRKPLRIKALLLDFTASLESYGDFITAMYKIMNLMRQSDS